VVKESIYNPEEIKDKLVADFPSKIARKRAKAIVVNTGTDETPQIAANPGLFPA